MFEVDVVFSHSSTVREVLPVGSPFPVPQYAEPENEVSGSLGKAPPVPRVAPEL